MKCKEATDREFGFDNSDENACGWCDFRFICHEGVLGKNLNLGGEDWYMIQLKTYE